MNINKDYYELENVINEIAKLKNIVIIKKDLRTQEKKMLFAKYMYVL